MDKVLAALRSSEFWAVVFQAVIEAMHAPVPDEVKVIGWAYVALRVLSKAVKYIFPNPGSAQAGWFKNDAAVILAIALSMAALPMRAQASTVLDLDSRAHITANAGCMVLTTGPQWSGGSLGATALYNLHPQFSIFGAYDHGFPINDVDRHLNVWRAVGSLRVHPNAFVGFGYVRFSRDVQGGLAQFLITKQVAPRLALGGVYAHVFSRDQLDDFEYLKVYVNYHVLGKE